MAEVRLAKIRHGSNSLWDGLKIIRASEIGRAFSFDEFIFVTNPSGINSIASLMMHTILGTF